MLLVLCLLIGALSLGALLGALWPQRTIALPAPISDEEFIRRCAPGVDRDIALKVRRIISEQLGIEYDRIYPEHRFVEDLGCD